MRWGSRWVLLLPRQTDSKHLLVLAVGGRKVLHYVVVAGVENSGDPNNRKFYVHDPASIEKKNVNAAYTRDMKQIDFEEYINVVGNKYGTTFGWIDTYLKKYSDMTPKTFVGHPIPGKRFQK